MPTVVSPRGLNGKKSDFPAGYDALLAEAKRLGYLPATATREDIKQALRTANLTLHHYDCTLQVVPYLLHKGLGHRGSASDMRNNLLQCPQ